MLNNYFQHQSHIADIDCNFRCPDDCRAPGCRKVDIVVEVTLFDLIRLSRFLNIPVSELFSQHCYPGLIVSDVNIRYMILLIKMKKPCLFLSGNLCDVHAVKPLSCRLFPELYHVRGLLPELSKKPLFHSFPCLKKPIIVSKKRNKAIRKLEKMSLREQALSYEFLFGVPRFVIDKKPLRKKFRQTHSKHRRLSIKDYDILLKKQLESYGFIENVTKKISRLNADTEITNLFEKLSDRVMMEDLMEKMVRPTVVHRLEKNNIIRLKRSLRPPATSFM